MKGRLSGNSRSFFGLVIGTGALGSSSTRKSPELALSKSVREGEIINKRRSPTLALRRGYVDVRNVHAHAHEKDMNMGMHMLIHIHMRIHMRMHMLTNLRRGYVDVRNGSKRSPAEHGVDPANVRMYVCVVAR